MTTKTLTSEDQRNLAEARKLNAEAAHAESSAAIRALELEWKKEENEQREAQKPFRGGEYLFLDDVNDRSIHALLDGLDRIHRNDPEAPMNITINSPGGSVIDGMHAIDVISLYSLRGGGTHKVTMTVRGMAASMAGILLQAADERVMGPQSHLLIHEVSAYAGGKLGAIQDEVKFLEMLSKRVIDLFISRCDDKITAATFKKNWNRTDWWLGADEAKKYGFIDRIG